MNGAAQEPLGNSVEELCLRAQARAEELFVREKLYCAPAALLTLNECLGGGLEAGLLRRLTAGLPEGMGKAGCVCGALSGANLALGLFLADDSRSGGKALRRSAKALHDVFKAEAGSTCCRVLTKKAKGDEKVHANQCAWLTGMAAREACRIILAERPDLLSRDLPHPPARKGWRRLFG